MKTPRTKAVLFDFGGTLDYDGVAWADRFYPLYQEQGIDVPRPRFNQAFYTSDDGLPARFNLKGLSLENTLFLQVGEVIEILAPGRMDARDKVVRRFLGACRSHFKRNRPLLEQLAKRYRLGVVSNFYGNLDAILRSEGLADLFEAVADSGVVGAAKPEPGIFLHAIKALGANARECLMVGDSIARDMRGAEGLGMAHALINPGPGSCCEKAWTIKILPDLAGRLA
ncbi:MAG: hypothetical protein A3J74_05145 [Elusimicrobia bacterium RIFCSPHIGHO2_02_FULL_57_9]|nr:MAG: hypothetical protein A3J74_05145 [Elusimicrobia bacterium RIFCSPHIGHO2_02_FULL_57_9]